MCMANAALSRKRLETPALACGWRRQDTVARIPMQQYQVNCYRHRGLKACRVCIPWSVDHNWALLGKVSRAHRTTHCMCRHDNAAEKSYPTSRWRVSRRLAKRKIFFSWRRTCVRISFHVVWGEYYSDQTVPFRSCCPGQLLIDLHQELRNWSILWGVGLPQTAVWSSLLYLLLYASFRVIL
jgi:hypothetical protein